MDFSNCQVPQFKTRFKLALALKITGCERTQKNIYITVGPEKEREQKQREEIGENSFALKILIDK